MNINSLCPLPGILLFVLFGTTLFAQKPTKVRIFEKRIDQIESTFQDGNMEISNISGYPVAIYNPGFQLSSDEPQAMALQYLQANKSLLGLSNKDINDLVLHAVRESLSGTTVRLRQYYNNIPVGKSEITIHINPKNVVTCVMNSFRYGIELQDTSPGKSTAFCRQVLIDQVGISGTTSHEQQNLEIFYNNGDAKLVYRTSVISDNPVGEWEAFVDAKTGEVLKLEDISFYYHDHKAALSPAIPASNTFLFMATGTGRAFVPDPLSSANATYGNAGFTDNNDADSPQLSLETQTITLQGITFDGTNYNLSGPWAQIVDTESPLNGLFSQTTSDWTPSRNAAAFEATNTYYHIDESMRYINIDLGLNIHPSAYAGGVKFDPHGLNGADNSHYSGGSQVVAFGEGGVDDAEDSDVIHHELGHGLHDWVTNGGLSQVNGLSEGSGDYWAVSYNRRLGLWNSTDAPYNWVFNWDGHNPFWNGRVVNYAPIYPGGLVGQIHTDGQIWATAMMKVWDAIGSTQSDKAFWEGLGMTNGSTNQNSAANAVYQAALDMNYSLADLTGMHNALTSSGYALPDLPLPIELASFKGQTDGQAVRLLWTTLSETNNQYFDIERSLDGKNFTPIGKVASQLSGIRTSNYDFTDSQPYPTVNYYRLKQVDLDGKFTYSNILSFTLKEESKVVVFPNPATESLTIQTALLNNAAAEIFIFDSVGKLRLSKKGTNDKQLNLDISGLENGIYVVKIQSDNQQVIVRFSK